MMASWALYKCLGPSFDFWGLGKGSVGLGGLFKEAFGLDMMRGFFGHIGYPSQGYGSEPTH